MPRLKKKTIEPDAPVKKETRGRASKSLLNEFVFQPIENYYETNKKPET